jgi:hypothetical protein
MRRRIEQALQQVSAMPPASILETSSILATTALLKSTDMVSVVPLDVALLYARHGMLDVRPVDMPIAMAKLNILTRLRPRLRLSCRRCAPAWQTTAADSADALTIACILPRAALYNGRPGAPGRVGVHQYNDEETDMTDTGVRPPARRAARCKQL